jgi:hypothetical protein
MTVTDAQRVVVRERIRAGLRQGGAIDRLTQGGPASRRVLRRALKAWPWPVGFRVPDLRPTDRQRWVVATSAAAAGIPAHWSSPPALIPEPQAARLA